MSERKTDEIKFRVEPSVKARWQAAADEIGDGLSEFIRRCTEESILQHELWTKQNLSINGNVLIDAALEAETVTMLDPDLSQFQTLLGTLPETEKIAESQPPPQAAVPAAGWKPFGA
jgi:hypothetical protein